MTSVFDRCRRCLPHRRVKARQRRYLMAPADRSIWGEKTATAFEELGG